MRIGFTGLDILRKNTPSQFINSFNMLPAHQAACFIKGIVMKYICFFMFFSSCATPSEIKENKSNVYSCGTLVIENSPKNIPQTEMFWPINGFILHLNSNYFFITNQNNTMEYVFEIKEESERGIFGFYHNDGVVNMIKVDSRIRKSDSEIVFRMLLDELDFSGLCNLY